LNLEHTMHTHTHGVNSNLLALWRFQLSVFPLPQAFFAQNNVPQESRFNLKKNVEEEYRKWKSMSNENEIITHFSLQGSPPLFLCLLWKMLLETDHINQMGFRSRSHSFSHSLAHAHTHTHSGFPATSIRRIVHLHLAESSQVSFICIALNHS